MTHIKAYIKRLSDNAMTKNIVPADVPTCKVTQHRISFLTKQELTMMMQQLEHEVNEAYNSGDKHRIYAAYLWRAITRMLYTA